MGRVLYRELCWFIARYASFGFHALLVILCLIIGLVLFHWKMDADRYKARLKVPSVSTVPQEFKMPEGGG